MTRLRTETHSAPSWKIRETLHEEFLRNPDNPPAKIVLHPKAHLAWIRDSLVADAGSEEHAKVRTLRGVPCEIGAPGREIVVEEGWVVAQVVWMDGPWVTRVVQVVIPGGGTLRSGDKATMPDGRQVTIVEMGQ